MSGKLYTQPSSFHGYKVQITAKFSKTNLAVEKIYNVKDLDTKKFLLHKLPAYEGDDGYVLNDSHSISFYLANEQLRGKDLIQQAAILQWMNYADGDLYHDVSTWVYPVLGLVEADEKSVKNAEMATKAHLKRLNDYLLNHTYLVGERITLADIFLCCHLLTLYQKVLEPTLRKDYGNLNRWFDTLIHQIEFSEVLGEVTLAEHAPIPPSKKTETKTEAKSEAKQIKAQEKDDDDTVVEEKRKNPFDLYPKGSFDMDDFKRFYSNNEVSKSIPYFWEKFDPEHYSIWYCEYLYPEELTLSFMSCNLISGMFQRLEKLNKNAFASMILFGEDHKSTISGIWIWRSHELVFNLSENWQVDYQSYSWVKLDPSLPDNKKKINEYLSWEGEFDGKKFNQAKIFK